MPPRLLISTLFRREVLLCISCPHFLTRPFLCITVLPADFRSRQGGEKQKYSLLPYNFCCRQGDRGTRPQRADPPPRRPVTPFGYYSAATKSLTPLPCPSRLASQARPEARSRQSHGTPTNPRCRPSFSYTPPKLHHTLDLLPDAADLRSARLRSGRCGLRNENRTQIPCSRDETRSVE